MTIAQDIVFGVVLGSYVALGAIGFTLVYGLVNMINFAHGEYMTVGGFVGFIAAESLGLPVPLAILPVLLVSAVIGWGLARLFFTPLQEAGPIPLLLTSIGLGFILRNGFRLVAGPQNRYVELETATYRFEQLGGLFVTDRHLFIVFTALAAFVVFHLVLTRTKIGVAMRATGDNESLALVTGIDTDRVRTYVWLVSSGLAGLAGYLLAVQQAASPSLGFDQLLLILTAAILGGAGSVYGAVVGAYVLGITIALSVSLLPTWATNLGTTMAFVVLIAVLLVRPGGIAGTEVRYEHA